MALRHALVSAALLLAGASVSARPPKVGDVAPDFYAKTFNGEELRLADFKGQVLIINIWATWCVPCKQELPLLDGYLRQTQKYGLSVIAITTEVSIAEWQLKPLQKFLNIPLLHKLRGPYEFLDGVPTNYVIGRDGKVRYAQAGAFTLDELNAVIIPLLKEAPPAPVGTR